LKAVNDTPSAIMNRLRVVRLAAAFATFSPIAYAQSPAVQPIQQGARAPTAAYFTADDALEINTYAVADVTDDGHWVALTQAVRRDAYGNDYRHDGDPTYVHPAPLRLWAVDARTGQRQPVFPDKRAVRGMRWSPDGSQLAMLAWNGDVYEPAIWNRATAKLTTLKLPAGKYVAEASDLRWSVGGSQVVFTVHTSEWRKKARDAFAQITTGPVFVQSSKDPFLSWDDLRRMGNRRSVGALDVKSGQYRELVPETMLASYTLTDDGKAIAYAEDQTKKTEYEAGGNDSRLVARSLATGEARTLLSSTRGAAVVWSEDGTRYAYSRDGRVYVAALADTTGRLVAGPPEPAKGPAPTPPDSSSRTGRGSARPDRFTATRFSPRGDALLVSNRDGLWVIDLTTNAREIVMATDSVNLATPRATVAAWSEDGSKLYFTVSSRTKWERGIVRYDRATKQTRDLVKDARSYSGLRLSKDGNTSFITIAEGNRPPDIFAGDGNLAGLHRFIEANPQLAAKHIGPTELLPYLDADGHSKYAVVHYPADYQKGKTYPTVFIIYEDFFDDTWDVAANILSANGYLVVKPSVDFETGFPGEAWLKGVTAAANKLIELGVADSARLGVQGTSYGGYATNLLVTQTNRFKAAINISGKVDIISFYTDSPRLGVRNITAAERQQDRIGATLWQQPQKYVQHSAIMFADRIQTPLMLITGAQDSNVPADNTREMYYGLRRLGKEVVWVNYLNGGHGGGVASTDDFLDMYRRMVGWYDEKLKKKSTDKTATDDR
jgi:dipeptidyl aminopeptidase/acylaminoacyl peptidase